MSATPQDPPVYLVLGATGRVGVALCGRLDGVVNCVGSTLLKPAHMVSQEEWIDCIDLNLGSAFAAVHAAVPAMQRDGGSIVLLSAASAIAWLLSPEQSRVTGQVVGVDGGLSTLRPL